MRQFNTPVASGLTDANLATKVCDFLLRNPDEFLDVDAIVAKFDVARCSIHSELSLHTQAGLLTRFVGEEHGYVYKRGPELSWENVEVMNG